MVARAKIREVYGQNIFNTTAFFFASAIAPGPRLKLDIGLQPFIEKMIEASGVTVHVSRKVSQISIRDSKRRADVHSVLEGSQPVTDSFDAVVIAAPLVSSGIDFPDILILLGSVEYADRYVTHFISPLELNPASIRP